MNKNETVLLNLVKKSLFGVDVSFADDTDWKAVQNEALAQAVVALAAVSVPAQQEEEWCEPAAQSIAHYIQSLFEQEKLVKLLKENCIPFLIIKGFAAAVYYPAPKLRTMGDIDFIVDPDRYDDTVKLLKDNGYTPDDYHDNDRHCGFKKGRVCLELHRRYSHDEYDIEPMIISGMKKPVTRTLNGHDFPTLPDYENGLLILEHITFHVRSEIGIRQIIDWAMFVNSVLDDNNYKEHFLPLLKEHRLVTFCETVTLLCKMYLGLPNTVTWCDNADKKTAEELMRAVMKNGNFGCKKSFRGETPMQGLTFTVKRNGFFKTLQQIGLNNFGICRQNRLLGAFAWLFQLFRFVFRGVAAVFRGENLIKDANDGTQKAEFYKRLGL